MQTRHRIPTIFNLSMVDVLCCALGCIILLWLVYFKIAREQAVEAGQTNKQLSASKLELAKTARELEAHKLELAKVARALDAERLALEAGKQRQEYLSGQHAEVTDQRNKLVAKAEQTDRDLHAALAQLKNALTQIAGLQKDVKNLEAINVALSVGLAQKIKDHGMLAAQLAAAAQTVRELEQMVGDQKGSLSSAAGQAAELKSKLSDAEKNAGKLDQLVTTLKAQSKEYSNLLVKSDARVLVLERDLDKKKLELADAGKRYGDLLALKNLLDQNLGAVKGDLAKSEKDLAEAKLTNHGLSGQTRVLSQQIDKLKAAADNRFAGIEMTGTNVLFIVDMSGSMGMKDDVLEDPDKWPLVCEIMGKLMQSLPDLKQFQIILFSEKIRYPLAGAGKWHEYKGPASVKNAIAAVRAVTPVGGTNMSVAFEEAFRYRAQGLDTIYVLSDGLPNMGDGLPANADKWTESQRNIVLGKYIRDRLKTTWNVPYGRWAKQRVRINAVGFYFDSPDVGAFLWALARDNDGSFVGLSKP